MFLLQSSCSLMPSFNLNVFNHLIQFLVIPTIIVVIFLKSRLIISSWLLVYWAKVLITIIILYHLWPPAFVNHRGCRVHPEPGFDGCCSKTTISKNSANQSLLSFLSFSLIRHLIFSLVNHRFGVVTISNIFSSIGIHGYVS